MKSSKQNLLESKIGEIDGLIKEYDPEKMRQWREETLMVLDGLITEESKYYKNFEEIGYRSQVLRMNDPEWNLESNKGAYKRGLEKARSSLNAIIFGLNEGLF